MTTPKRCPESRAHYAHEYGHFRIQCPGGPDETPTVPALGHVQQTKWGEWQAVCAVPRCGWTFSQGNRTREDAEKYMRTHAAIAHPPAFPVTQEA